MVAAAGHRRAREERLGFWDGRRERDEEAASRRRVGELGFGVEWTASNSSPQQLVGRAGQPLIGWGQQPWASVGTELLLGWLLSQVVPGPTLWANVVAQAQPATSGWAGSSTIQSRRIGLESAFSRSGFGRPLGSTHMTIYTSHRLFISKISNIVENDSVTFNQL